MQRPMQHTSALTNNCYTMQRTNERTNEQDTVTGFLLAGVGHRTAEGANFLIVKQDTKLQQIEDAFKTLSARDDVGIILINQHVANDIRHVLKDYNATIPTVLEIPSKEHPYDPEQDYIMQRVNMFLGGGS
uniref:V-type proton ATPase subunit F n=1 Tax=Craspedostauros australis TaxID=1486917 RepID=A0A6T6GNN6_9STRA|mmetsp:Transcript_4209/g.10973  ORF Transcript_4209/g.10973 Transcript_4209/m.10973 type:complete len:131 (+) Transcript_4209:382-774(+)